MARRKTDKKISSLEPFFESIFVCNHNRLRPFIEVFVHEPENVAQQNLGTLLGVFEVTDLSEDSSYIANYLISVIKKEYSARPKRGAIESFEAALHKANLALSKLAEHGNVKWIGRLNALIAVIEKNSLHLSQAGTASAFLLRSKSLTDISVGLAEDMAEPHPLKTFVNISSGHLEHADKIIITTDSLFNIFSLEEIKKSALRFPDGKFIQFLKTALNNELEKACVLVVDIREKEEPVPVAQIKAPDLNAFSSAAFARTTAPAKDSASSAETISTKTEENSAEKTGHIYIKGSESVLPERDRTAEILETLRSILPLIWGKIMVGTKKLFSVLVRALKNITIPRPKIPLFKKKISEPAAADIRPQQKFVFQKIFAAAGFWRRFWPDFSRLKKTASELDYQQRLYAALVVIVIVLVPILALRLQNYVQQKNIKLAAQAPVVIPLAQDKNVMRLDNLNNIYTANNIFSAVNLNGKIYAVTQTQVVDPQSQEAFPLPGDFGQIKLISGMDDLNLIFLINQSNRIIAWSPVAKKFQDNTLSIPDSANITAAGTYLTYLYLVDAQNNQIYRYPRANGGFGDKTNWLKDSVDLSRATGLALSENIYVASDNDVLELFKGKKQDFNLEDSSTPIAPYKVYARSGSQNIYILDKKNSRLVKLDQNGNILTQYFNYQIGSANNFIIDEQNNNAYIATTDNIFFFALN